MHRFDCVPVIRAAADDESHEQPSDPRENKRGVSARRIRRAKKRPGKSLEMPRRSLGGFAQDWSTDDQWHQMPDMDGIQAFYPENRILTQLPSENGRFLRI